MASLTITIVVAADPGENVHTHIVAEGSEIWEIRPMLERAIADLQSELAALPLSHGRDPVGGAGHAIREHDLKVVPEFWDDLDSGRKTFEVRYNGDRDFSVGDTLRLREWSEGTSGYTGREIFRRIEYILTGEPWGLRRDYSVLALQEIKRDALGEYEGGDEMNEMLARVVRAMRAAEDTEGDAYWAMARAAIAVELPGEMINAMAVVIREREGKAAAITALLAWQAAVAVALAEQEIHRDALGEYRDTPEPPP